MYEFTLQFVLFYFFYKYGNISIYGIHPNFIIIDFFLVKSRFFFFLCWRQSLNFMVFSHQVNIFFIGKIGPLSFIWQQKYLHHMRHFGVLSWYTVYIHYFKHLVLSPHHQSRKWRYHFLACMRWVVEQFTVHVTKSANRCIGWAKLSKKLILCNHHM